MKKIYGVVIIFAILVMVMFCGNVVAKEEYKISPGPAPSHGDGIPDGSGFDKDDWPNEDKPAKGPAPNSGDGIPDGSGF